REPDRPRALRNPFDPWRAGCPPSETGSEPHWRWMPIFLSSLRRCEEKLFRLATDRKLRSGRNPVCGQNSGGGHARLANDSKASNLESARSSSSPVRFSQHPYVSLALNAATNE